MFISEAQLEMIDRIWASSKLDILETHIGVLSALVCRGLARIYYAKKPGEITKTGLTLAGEVVAQNMKFYRGLPKYKAVLDQARDAKRQRYE